MNPEKLFNDITQFVAESRTLLQEGAVMELAGLEKHVLILCEDVLLLSQDERLHYADRLQQLLAELTSLGEELAAQRDQVAEKMRNLPEHKKATTAYRVVDASDQEEGE